LIPSSIPLVLTSGSVDKVYAQIPFPNLWSAPLTLSLDALTLDFTLSPPTPFSSNGKSPEQPRAPLSGKSRQYDLSSSVDLAASVTSAADEFLHEELDAYEEAELDRSIRQSLILSRSDPFVQDTVPGAFPSSYDESGRENGEPLPATVESTTVLAGLVERILSRLEFKINTVRIRIRHGTREGECVFELRIGQIKYADESDQEDTSGSTTRTVRISEISIYMLDSPQPRSRPTYTPSRSSSTSSASSSGVEGNMAMMSSAIADLRQSTFSEVDSEASVYQSAMSDRSAFTAPDDIPTAPETGHSTPRLAEDEGEMILSFGNEDVVLRMKTTPSQSTSSNESQPTLPQRIGSKPTAHRAPSSHGGSALPSLDFDVSIGSIAILLLPRQMASVLSISRALSSPIGKGPSPPTGIVADVSKPNMDGRVRIKGLYVTTTYDMAVESTPSFLESVSSYWSRPSSFYLPVGHLKLKLEGLEGSYSTTGISPRQQSSHSPARPPPRRSSTTSTIRFGTRPPTLTLRISDLSIFEYIATDTTAADDEPENTIPGGAYPVLLFDAGLAKQYDIAPPGRHTYGPGVNTFPEFDAVDWRNSGLHKKSGAEKAWKVRPKGKGALKLAPGVEVDNSPVVLLRKELAATSREWYRYDACYRAYV